MKKLLLLAIATLSLLGCAQQPRVPPLVVSLPTSAPIPLQPPELLSYDSKPATDYSAKAKDFSSKLAQWLARAVTWSTKASTFLGDPTP